jgi:hypothetical protein
MTASPQLLSSRVISVLSLAIAALIATPFFATNVWAESPMPHTTHTTMVIFTDHPMEDDQWSALVRELHKIETSLETTTRAIAGSLEVFRGRDLVTGLDVDVAVSVKIIGDCALLPGPRRTVVGALGWVKKVDGEIQPFIDVSCERIAEMLEPMALGMDRERRNTVMSEAIARVIAHEWIHIATQDAGHQKNGVMQSQFEVSDLLAGDNPVYPRRHIGHGKKRLSGF